MSKLAQIANDIGLQLLAKRWRLVTAESCTGGWLAQVMTANAGSSQWFERGFVTYSNVAKQQSLGVDGALLAAHGAVSLPVALAMAEGALHHSVAEVAMAITGIAGPDGGSDLKPVGTVCFGWAVKEGVSASCLEYFAGDRRKIRYAAVKHALQLLSQLIY